jgi:flavin-dependent dehydrogenase
MYDAIVVGARCAGSPTAMLLARKGYRVLMVDRATFPSDMLSGHYIHQAGMASLRRWGLLDRVAATGAPAIRRVTFDVGPFALTGSPPPAEGGVDAGYCVRRTVLDKLLVEAAVEAGAELRERFAVTELLRSGGRVVGIRGQHNGKPVAEHARIVIGADGPRSLVARQVGAYRYDVRPDQTCAFYSYWSGVDIEGGEIYARDGRQIVVLPTNHGLTEVGAMWPVGEFQAFRADPEGNLLRTLDEHAPALAEQVRAGRREERMSGIGESPNFFRTPHGPGWALVGDAGYHKDAITGQGITDAFRDAELLAEALDDGFAGRRPLELALARYQQRRDEAAGPMYDFTVNLARLAPPPPEMQDLFGALRGNQPDTDAFMGLMAGTTSIPAFFAPANVERIIGAAHQLAKAA